VLLGLALSPAVLGNLAPELRDRLFGAEQPLASIRAAFDDESARQIEQLGATGVTEVAVQEHLRQRQQDWLHQVAAFQLALDRRATGLIFALLAALAVVMTLEAWLGPQPDAAGRGVVRPAYRRLVTVRYALLAMIVALALARPGVLGVTSLPLIIATITLALLAGLIPLGKTPPHAEP